MHEPLHVSMGPAQKCFGGPALPAGPPISRVVMVRETWSRGYPFATVNGPATPPPLDVTQTLPGLAVPAAPLRSRMS